MTTPISLIVCLNTIKQYAFVSSAYPVIITLEDHLTDELQAKVAEVSFRFVRQLVFLVSVVSDVFLMIVVDDH